MASPTQWTWVWVNSGSWWWTGRHGVLQSMGSQRVGHDWATELNWTGDTDMTVSWDGRQVSSSNVSRLVWIPGKPERLSGCHRAGKELSSRWERKEGVLFSGRTLSGLRSPLAAPAEPGAGDEMDPRTGTVPGGASQPARQAPWPWGGGAIWVSWGGSPRPPLWCLAAPPSTSQQPLRGEGIGPRCLS